MSVLQITPAERTALQMLADGLAHHDIACNLRLSEYALDAELMTLFERMGVAGRNQAIAEAVRRGLVITRRRCQEPSETGEHPEDGRRLRGHRLAYELSLSWGYAFVERAPRCRRFQHLRRRDDF
jgi:DNA-binding CsgD family transcriptional regulator